MNTDHYLEIRHDPETDDAVFEVAQELNGRPGRWREVTRTPWDQTTIPFTARAELKGGTTGLEHDARTLSFDAFRAAQIHVTETFLFDDFNDNGLDPTLWRAGDLFTDALVDAGTHVHEQNQRLEVELRANASGTKVNGVTSAHTDDLTNAGIQVHLAAVRTDAPQALMTVTVGTGDTYYTWRLAGSTLAARKMVDSTSTLLKSVTFDVAQHAWLRIRHDQAHNTVVFETAPDVNGAPGAWTPFRAQSWDWDPGIPLTGVHVEVKAGTTGPMAGGIVAFDDLEVTRWRSAGTCPPGQTCVGP